MQFLLRFPVKKVAADSAQPAAVMESTQTPKDEKPRSAVFQQRPGGFKRQANDYIQVANCAAGIGEQAKEQVKEPVGGCKDGRNQPDQAQENQRGQPDQPVNAFVKVLAWRGGISIQQFKTKLRLFTGKEPEK